MTEIEDKVVLEILRDNKILEEAIIADIFNLYLQLKKAGENISLVEIFINRGYLSHTQAQELNILTSTKSQTFNRIGEYNIIKKLGTGGMGSVYLAQKNENSPLVALKILSRSNGQDEKTTFRFKREFLALQQLKHPNIIRGIEQSFYNGYHFYVMEYFEGENLKKYIEKNHPLNHRNAVGFIKKVALALQYAHHFGIIHRDIKPENLLITKHDETIKLIDFGLVKMQCEENMSLTKTQSIMGTPYFMSSEQAKNSKAVDFRSDIYSLGATLFFMLTHEYPIEGTTTYEILASLISGHIKTPQKINANIPSSLNQLILNMMAYDINHRYQTYDSLIHDIDLFLEDKSVKALIAPKKRANKSFLIGISITMILIAFLFFGWWSNLFTQKNISEKQQSIKPEKARELTENDRNKVDEDQSYSTSKEDTKTILKYRIINSFDRQYKRQEAMSSFEELDEKLDDYLNYLSTHELINNNQTEGSLIARAFSLLAFCGAGYDFYQAPERKTMERYLKYIIDAQISSGKWSSELWVNAICTNAIIESFAMYGSEQEELSAISLNALHELGLQVQQFHFSSTSDHILGSHLFITAFTLARIAGLPKFEHLNETQIAIIRKEIINMTTANTKERKMLMVDKMDVEATSQILGKQRDVNLFIKTLEEKLYKPQSCEEAYFLLLFIGVQRDKTKYQGLLKSITRFFESKPFLTNEINKYSFEENLIITYSIAALAIENIYRIPQEAILFKRESRREFRR